MTTNKAFENAQVIEEHLLAFCMDKYLSDQGKI